MEESQLLSLRPRLCSEFGNTHSWLNLHVHVLGTHTVLADPGAAAMWLGDSAGPPAKENPSLLEEGLTSECAPHPHPRDGCTQQEMHIILTLAEQINKQDHQQPSGKNIRIQSRY